MNSKLLDRIFPVRHFIHGELVGSFNHQEFDDTNPATDQLLSKVSLGSKSEIDAAVASAQRGLQTSGWHEWPIAKRCEVINRLADLIDLHRQELAMLETRDTGKPISESLDGDVTRAGRNLKFFAKFAAQQLPDNWQSEDGSRHQSYRTPLGIVGLITPWNLPLYLETWKLAPALAQGNAVILKPAELTPLTATALAVLAFEAGVPAGVFNVVHGFGANSAGQALVEHPKVRAISFTGETTTGSAIMRSAADHLKKLSFELGGKGATVICETADLDQAVPTACRAAFRNQGQICLAGSRLIVHHKIHDEVVNRLAGLAKQIQPADPELPATTMGSLISRDHRAKVESYIQYARDLGLKIYCGGSRPHTRAEIGAFLMPTIIGEVPQDSRLIQEEVFGPVLTVQKFSTTQEALSLLNGTPYGLSCSVWTKDRQEFAQLQPRIRTGLVWLNSWFLRDLHTAFGGMKRSGIGREGGRFSLDFFSEYQTVSTPAAYHDWIKS
jgi:aminomuconate-semialdehyde/2-hydroxymuconate-6-semialdehyde dehydrogenase